MTSPIRASLHHLVGDVGLPDFNPFQWPGFSEGIKCIQSGIIGCGTYDDLFDIFGDIGSDVGRYKRYD